MLSGAVGEVDRQLAEEGYGPIMVTADVMRVLGLRSDRSVRRYRRSGRLPAVSVDGVRPYYLRASVARLIAGS